MSDNPYESPQSDARIPQTPWPTVSRWETHWSGFLWATIGLGGGTILATPFVFGLTMQELLGRAIGLGGIIGFILGWRYGVRRERSP